MTEEEIELQSQKLQARRQGNIGIHIFTVKPELMTTSE